MAKGYSVLDALNKNSKAGIDESPKARFRIKDISVFKIYSNSMNFYPQDGIEEKAGEILTVGLLESLAVKYEPCEKGDYKLISGERRWRALRLLVEKGYKEFELVSCQVRNPQNEHEEKIEIIIANSSRTKSIHVMIKEEQELKRELEYMKENKLELRGYNLQSGRLRDVIASMLKVSKTKVAQMEAVNNNLIQEFKEELKKECLTFSAAYALSGMTSSDQRKALEKYIETGELTFADIQSMKEEKATKEQIARQMSFDDIQEKVEEPRENSLKEIRAGDDYEVAHPEGIASICYSCTEYETCNVKTGTCTKCNKYKNRTEVYKTDEQKYSEEQDKIDKETKKKLLEIEDEEKMKHLPSDTQKKQEIKKKYIKVSGKMFERIASEKQHFIITKNNDFKIGEEIAIKEFYDGKATEKTLKAIILYMEDDITSSALEEGFCVIDLKPRD